ncbi:MULTISPECIES: polyphosphate kinase 1 [unclassified Sphingobacterium]|uniref:polyphosphate kinase 1 n=1 Tax=unclassified Sphingobacterium TaxID=2609468 RepID=UPI0010433F44|nr:MULTISPECIES: polyphosphate kinase 1 [unclassified Sphingobacterium]MBB2949663.1 polyphosphate kinase [Sphingobacterium sp. JUb56]MCS3556102.1 polyphosphate kinase [Sphingobacterium sp. JUb21]TCR08478.1 polyphosphate kinase [Sphingobacterium sp. JUb20]
MARKFIPRDVSWLSFNSRVLQEAADETVPLPSKIKFLGIFSNNLDEFFRVRIPGLKRAIDIKDKEANTSFFEDPQIILDEVNTIVIKQQKKFDNFWALIQKEMAQQHVYIKDASQLNLKQEEFVRNFYSEDVESNVIPLLLDDSRPMPYLRDKSLYLGISMRKQEWEYETRFAIIEIPTTLNGRFVILPASAKEKHIILLEDIIKFNLPYIFSYFGFDEFHAHVFKITKDAEFDIDNDINTTLAEKISKGIKNRRKGKTTRFIFDKEMDPRLVEFLIKKLQLTKKDNIIPGQKIHNFKHFMDFPNVFKQPNLPITNPAFTHPQLNKTQRITDIIIKKDILLSFPYHTFRPVIDLLREAAMDPDVKTIQITAYRLASNSKIVNALINAARNGKDVTVMLELQARFDEENNLFWKEKLELEGIRVLTGVPNKKVHAKLCIIKKRVGAKTIQYGFVSTGNINEKTAKLYGDYCLLTSNRSVMADINKVFHFLKKPKSNPAEVIKNCNSLLICPTDMRNGIIHYIDKEIEEVKAGRKARIILKVNSLSDRILIKKLYDAAEAGVQLDLIVRGIYCATNQTKFKRAINAISIVDEFLEHARVMYFYATGKEVTYISSADWMTRNLDHRIEAAVKINSKKIRDEIKDMLQIQLRDNVKARILNNELNNRYVENDKESCRSQIEIYNYLRKKTDEV